MNILAQELGTYVVKRCQNTPGSSSWLVSIQAKHTGKVFAHFFEATTEEQARAELGGMAGQISGTCLLRNSTQVCDVKALPELRRLRVWIFDVAG